MTTFPNSPAVLKCGLVLIDSTTSAVRADLRFSHPGGASDTDVTRLYPFVAMLPVKFRADPLSRATVLRHQATGRG